MLMNLEQKYPPPGTNGFIYSWYLKPSHIDLLPFLSPLFYIFINLLPPFHIRQQTTKLFSDVLRFFFSYVNAKDTIYFFCVKFSVLNIIFILFYLVLKFGGWKNRIVFSCFYESFIERRKMLIYTIGNNSLSSFILFIICFIFYFIYLFFI